MTQAQKLREIAKQLIKQAEELEAGIDRRQCKHGTYTNELFNTHGCKTCGSPKLVICSHPEKSKIANRYSSKYCNPQNCKYFESENNE